MPERHLITRFNPDSRNPELALVQVFSKKTPGISVDEQVSDEDNNYEGMLNLLVESDQSEEILTTWDKITTTCEFTYLKRASTGDTEFFKELEISSNDLLISHDNDSFMRFNEFLRRYAFFQAIDQAQNNPKQVLELKLEFRKTWLHPFSALQRRLLPHYIQSVVERLHNLVTTGEKRKTFKDRVLDRMMS